MSTKSELIAMMDSDLLNNCIEEIDRIIFQVPEEFIGDDQDQLNHFTSIGTTVMNSIESSSGSQSDGY